VNRPNLDFRRFSGLIRTTRRQPACRSSASKVWGGISTIANLVENKEGRMNRHTFLVDGDNVRHGLNKDPGFTDADRTILSIRLSSTKRPIGITQAVSGRALERSTVSLSRFHLPII